MSAQIGLLLKMLLPSVAISIAIKYFSITPTPVPTAETVLAIVLLPSTVIAIVLFVRIYRDPNRET